MPVLEMSGQSHYETYPRAERTQGRELDLILYLKEFQIIFKGGSQLEEQAESQNSEKSVDFKTENQD